MRFLKALMALAIVASLASCAREAPGAIGKADEPKPVENRLARETSPYLLLHATNPVDWYPWGPEAFEKAKKEEKPIFLSVGYSSCHWCHVMERESFADPAIARVLNERFVSIKVDREERPDVDQVYMTALQILTRGGGWPMNMFLTPDGRPFFGVTYLPPREKDGGEGLATLLDRVALAWRDDRKALLTDADRLSEAVNKLGSGAFGNARSKPSKETIDDAQARFADSFDPEFGGFNFDPNRPNRPKFPTPVDFLFLLDRHRSDPASKPEPLPMVVKTLDRIAHGGIRDQLAGGYHRYSTDRSWTVPHFEKMLYDNALMTSALVLAFEVTGDPRWKREAEATLGFVAESLTSPDGTFFSSLDADSPGGEGAVYVWSKADLAGRLKPEDIRIAEVVFGLDGPANFEGDRYVLTRPRSPIAEAEALGMTTQAIEARLDTIRGTLLEVRGRRPKLARDEKVLTSWNGLMIAAYADAARVFQSAEFRRAADRSADVLLARHRSADGRLLRTSKGDSPAKLDGFLEDYAAIAHGLLRLHAATGDRARLDQAKAIIDRMIADFADPTGGFFFTARDRETLFARIKDPFDGAIPGPNGLAALDLLDLSAATGDPSYRALALKSLDSFGPALAARPDGAPTILRALSRILDEGTAVKPPSAARPWPADPLGIGVQSGLITAKAALKPGASPRPGETFEAVVTLSIQPSWHLYANPSGDDLYKPTTLAIVPGSMASLVSVSYPAGVPRLLSSPGKTLPLYEGTVSIPCRLTLDSTAAPGPRTLSFLVRFQTCSEKACLAPATLTVPLDLK